MEIDYRPYIDFESRDVADYGCSEQPPMPIYIVEFDHITLPAVKGVVKWPSLN